MVRFLALTLLLVGCKKKDPEPLPEPAVEKVPLMPIQIGPALWRAGEAEAISVPITIENNREMPISWVASEIRLLAGTAIACQGKATNNVTVPSRSSATHMLEIDCQRSALGARDEVQAAGTILWDVGEGMKERRFELALKIQG